MPHPQNLPVNRWRYANMYLLGLLLIWPLALFASTLAGWRSERRRREPLPFEVSLLIAAILVVAIIVAVYIVSAVSARRYRILREHFGDAVILDVTVPPHTRQSVRMLRSARFRPGQSAHLVVGPHGVGLFSSSDPLRPDLALRWSRVGRVAATSDRKWVWVIIETHNPDAPGEHGVMLDFRLSAVHSPTLRAYTSQAAPLAEALATIEPWRERVYVEA